MRRLYVRGLLVLFMLMALSVMLPTALPTATARDLAPADAGAAPSQRLPTLPLDDPAPPVIATGLSGQVQYQGGAPAAGLSIQVRQDGEIRAVERTGSDGSYHFADLAPGAYELAVFDAAERPLGLLDGATVVVAPDQPTLHMATVDAPGLSTGLPELSAVPAVANPCIGPPQVTGTARITGTVIASDTGQPLQSAYIYAYSVNGTYSAYTDATGTYIIDELPAGSYRVEFNSPYIFSRGGYVYLDEWYNDKPTIQTADPVTVGEGATVANRNAVLSPGGSITGRVLGQGGTGLDDVSVYAYRVEDGQRIYASSASTDATGTYTIPRLLSGAYKIAYEPQTSGAAKAYLDGFSGNAADLDSATTIAVTAPNTTNAPNITLTRGAQVSGRVTAPAGTGLDGISIYLWRPGSTANSFVGTYVGETNADGTYTTTAVAPGTYWVEFEPQSYGDAKQYLGEYYNNASSRDTATSVTLAGGTVLPNINAQLAMGGWIAGRVTAPGGGGLANVNVEVYNANNSRVSSTSTDSQGNYRSVGLPAGSYKVYYEASVYSTSLCGYIGEWYNDKATRETADPVAVTLGAGTANINAELNTGTVFTGRITGADTGLPVSSVGINVYDANGNNSLASGYVSYSNGFYYTQGVPNGNYIINYDPYSNTPYIEEYYDNQREMSQATVLNANGAPVTGLNVTLDPGGWISGQVTGDGGAPLGDIDVEFYDPQGMNAGYGSTNNSGFYTSDALPPGPYTVLFRPYADGDDDAYAAEWYNDAPNRAAATPVNVTVGATIADINAQLARGGRITGRITGPDGAGLPDAGVYVYNSEGNYLTSGDANAQGNYTTGALATGSYQVYFYPGGASSLSGEWYNDKGSFETSDPVAVTAPDTTAGIDGQLVLGAVISGRVQAGGQPVANVQVRIFRSNGSLAATATTGTDGTYTSSTLTSGDYKVCFSPPVGRLIRECYNNKRPPMANADVVTVSAPTPRTDINADLETGRRIVGRVRDRQGNGLPNVNVAAYPASSGLAQASDEPLASGTTNDQGNYTLDAGLPQGSITLRFTPPSGSTFAATAVNTTVGAGSEDQTTDMTLNTVRRVHVPLIRR